MKQLNYPWLNYPFLPFIVAVNKHLCVQTKKILNGRAVTLGYCLQICCIPILKGHAKRPQTRIFCKNNSRKKCKKSNEVHLRFCKKQSAQTEILTRTTQAAKFFDDSEVTRFRSRFGSVHTSLKSAGIHLRFTSFLVFSPAPHLDLHRHPDHDLEPDVWRDLWPDVKHWDSGWSLSLMTSQLCNRFNPK